MTDIMELLDKVTNPGCFSASGIMDSILPGLSLKNIGTISLPLCHQQAVEIKKVSEQAPFGRGEDTVVDTTVRNVWQISAKDFEIANPAWNNVLAKKMKIIGNELGLHSCDIKFEPYKFLLYETGSFFTAHRDTEKIDNMFATLVVNLPSKHEGGELIISHGGQKKTCSFQDSEFNPAFVAFYADCYHEVKPITSGYRICLVYNLFITNRASVPTLSKQSQYIDDVEIGLKQWFHDEKDTPIFIYLLDHHYSEKNLSLSTLKNGDFAKVDTLLNIAKKNEYTAFLCLVSYHFSSYGDSIYAGRRGYRPDDLDESEYEEADILNEVTYAHNFINIDGGRISSAKLYIEEDDEIHAQIPLLDGPGQELSISEATGNEGATKDLWYHRGGVVIWKKEAEFSVAHRMDLNYKISFLKRLVNEQSANKHPYDQQVMTLADNIICEKNASDDRDISLELIKLGDTQLIKKYFLKHFKSYTLTYVNGPALLEALDIFNLDDLEEEIVNQLASKHDVFSWILSLLLNTQGLTDNNKKIISHWIILLWETVLNAGHEQIDIQNIIQIVSLLNLEALIVKISVFISNIIAGWPMFVINSYGPAAVNMLPYLDDKNHNKKIINKFIQHALKLLHDGFSSLPEKPKNLYRSGMLKCSCKLCAQVNEFLPKNDAGELIIPGTLKRNILHIESKIKESFVDIDVEIVRVPPKFKGMLTKNTKHYDIEMNTYKRAQAIITSLSITE